METRAAAGAASCGAGGCREAKEALTDGELPVGLATKALPAVALLHEIAAGDATAPSEPDERATVLAVDAGRAGKGGAFGQNVSAPALAALHREASRSAAVWSGRGQLGLVQVDVPGPPRGGSGHVDAALCEEQLAAGKAFSGTRQVYASLGKDPAKDFPVPRVVPTWPCLEASHASLDAQARESGLPSARREQLAHVRSELVPDLLDDLGLEELDGVAYAVLPPEETGSISLKEGSGADGGVGVKLEVDEELQPGASHVVAGGFSGDPGEV